MKLPTPIKGWTAINENGEWVDYDYSTISAKDLANNGMAGFCSELTKKRVVKNLRRGEIPVQFELRIIPPKERGKP